MEEVSVSRMHLDRLQSRTDLQMISYVSLYGNWAKAIQIWQ